MTKHIIVDSRQIQEAWGPETSYYGGELLLHFYTRPTITTKRLEITGNDRSGIYTVGFDPVKLLQFLEVDEGAEVLDPENLLQGLLEDGEAADRLMEEVPNFINFQDQVKLSKEGNALLVEPYDDGERELRITLSKDDLIELSKFLGQDGVVGKLAKHVKEKHL